MWNTVNWMLWCREAGYQKYKLNFYLASEHTCKQRDAREAKTRRKQLVWFTKMYVFYYVICMHLSNITPLQLLISNKQSLGFQNIKLVSANLDDKYNYEDCNGIIT